MLEDLSCLWTQGAGAWASVCTCSGLSVQACIRKVEPSERMSRFPRSPRKSWLMVVITHSPSFLPTSRPRFSISIPFRMPVWCDLAFPWHLLCLPAFPWANASVSVSELLVPWSLCWPLCSCSPFFCCEFPFFASLSSSPNLVDPYFCFSHSQSFPVLFLIILLFF